MLRHGIFSRKNSIKFMANYSHILNNRYVACLVNGIEESRPAHSDTVSTAYRIRTIQNLAMMRETASCFPFRQIRAWSRTARVSSIYSMSTDRSTRSGVMPTDACSALDMRGSARCRLGGRLPGACGAFALWISIRSEMRGMLTRNCNIFRQCLYPFFTQRKK